MGSERVLWRRHHIFAEQRVPRQGNPYFPEKNRGRNPRPRILIGWALFVLVGAFAVYELFFSPFFRVEVISVEGNRYLRTGDVRARIQAFSEKKILGFIPRRSLLLLPPGAIESDLRSSIAQQQAIESLRVERRLPGHIHVVIKERTPNLVYENGGQSYLLDRAGVVTQLVDPTDHIDASFPLLLDQTTRPIAIGANVLQEQQIEALFAMQKALRDRSDIPIERFYLPPVQCAKFFAQEEKKPEEGSDQTENQEAKNANTNRLNNENQNVNAKKNTNTNKLANTANKNTNTAAEPIVCDKAAEVFRSIEIRAKSTEDWEIYFRIDDSIDEQVTRLLRVLQEKHLDRATLDYIDLRFGERVIIK